MNIYIVQKGFTEYCTICAYLQISSIAKLGKVNPIIVKCLFKVVLDDIYYEITCTQSYLDDIQDDLNRFKQIEKYEIKMNEAKTEKKKKLLYGRN